MTASTLGWIGIVRLGLVQTALGAVVVLTTSTLNRVMVVELALPAALPGALVAVHHVVQLLRPRLGYGSDQRGRATPWIVAGMALLALGGLLAAVATAWMGTSVAGGTLLAVAAFVLIGLGSGGAGTSLLVLLAKRVAPERRAAAASIVWAMMIAGFVVTATGAGHLLDPFSPTRLVAVTGGVSLAAFLLAVLAVWRVEAGAGGGAEEPAKAPFRQALAQVWAEPRARRFTVFVFVSMLAYSMQDLILEPFAGIAFGFTPGQSTRLAGVQHGGVLLGMVTMALAGSFGARARLGTLHGWIVAGCIGSALALLGLAAASLAGPGWPLRPTVFALGFCNGAFAVAAIGSMMELAGQGRRAREGVRMGMWGAAQAIAFALGGLTGAVAADLLRQVVPVAAHAYGAVFAAEALLFLVSAAIPARGSAVGRIAPSAVGACVAGTKGG